MYYIEKYEDVFVFHWNNKNSFFHLRKVEATDFVRGTTVFTENEFRDLVFEYKQKIKKNFSHDEKFQEIIMSSVDSMLVGSQKLQVLM